MRDQEIIGLWEAYQQVCEAETGRGPRLIDAYDKPPYSDDAAVAKNPVKMKRKGPKMKGVVSKEEVATDLFDIILEHLVAEGYAETTEAALVIMANMSEEWRQDILEATGRDEMIAANIARAKASSSPSSTGTSGGSTPPLSTSTPTSTLKINPTPSSSSGSGLGGLASRPIPTSMPVSKPIPTSVPTSGSSVGSAANMPVGTRVSVRPQSTLPIRPVTPAQAISATRSSSSTASGSVVSQSNKFAAAPKPITPNPSRMSVVDQPGDDAKLTSFGPDTKPTTIGQNRPKPRDEKLFDGPETLPPNQGPRPNAKPPLRPVPLF